MEDEAIIAQDIADKIRDLGYDVAGIAGNSEKALDQISNRLPDLVLCDIHIKGSKDGIEVAEIISKNYHIPFIFLTSLSDRNTLERAKKTLPFGYVIKPFDDRDLLSAIEMALYKHHSELERMEITKAKVDGLAASPFSEREFQIFLDITQGLNNDQIVKKEFISLNTVKYHIKNIFAKLDVSNRAEALHKVIELLRQT